MLGVRGVRVQPEAVHERPAAVEPRFAALWLTVHRALNSTRRRAEPGWMDSWLTVRLWRRSGRRHLLVLYRRKAGAHQARISAGSACNQGFPASHIFLLPV